MGTQNTDSRKVDDWAKSEGSTANKIKTERERKAKELERITGIKQPKKGQ